MASDRTGAGSVTARILAVSKFFVHVLPSNAPCTCVDAPWGRIPDLFDRLDDVADPELWDEICRRAQERTRVHIALTTPRRAHAFVPRGALSLAVAAVLLMGGFLAGRRAASGASVPQSAAAPIIVDAKSTRAAQTPAGPSTSGQRCDPTPVFRDPPGMK